MPSDAQKLTTHARKHLCLETAQLSRAYFYQSLTYCIIDSIFSLGVRYGQVENVVCHVHRITQWRIFRDHGTPFSAENQQIKTSELIREMSAHEDPRQTLFHNNGNANPAAKPPSRISKSNLVRKFAEVLAFNGVETFQTLANHANPDELDKTLCRLPSLRSGIAVRYFRMLSGDETQVKPDRMIQRFIEAGIGRTVAANDAAKLVQETCTLLKQEHPALTPRLLDHEIWKFQRNRKPA